jgi:pimeloyl-ACP methyl ester carboxylesterase
MTTPAHRTGAATSGDVTIFYRQFGRPGRMPVVILHGANYYDSADWIDVADALARDREVVAFDCRGYGQSTWSPSKDYSHDAQVGDVLNVLDHLGWPQAIVLGASRGGSYGIAFAADFPERTAALIVIDSFPQIGIQHPGTQLSDKPAINKTPRVHASVEAALASMSRDRNVPPGSPARARLEQILKPVEGGYVLRYRDPDFLNQVPTVPGKWRTRIPIDVDLWQELAKVKAPTLFVRATESQSGHDSTEAMERIGREFPRIHRAEVEGGHDVAAIAPDQLLDRVRTFLATETL